MKSIKEKLAWTLVAFVFTPLFVSCTEDIVEPDNTAADADNGIYKPLKVSEQQQALVESYNDFAQDLLIQVAAETEGNVVICPLTAEYVLGMLANG